MKTRVLSLFFLREDVKTDGMAVVNFRRARRRTHFSPDNHRIGTRADDFAAIARELAKATRNEF